MKIKIKELIEKERYLALKKIFKIIEKDHKIFIVGGFIRDIIFLNKKRDLDIDISTTAKTFEIRNLFSKNKEFLIKDIGGEKYGSLIIIYLKKNFKFDVTTTRLDIKNFGRYSEVIFIDNFKEDSKRRDFTINSLYCDLYGNIYDFNNGLTDIKNKNVNFIGDAEERIKEDFLRILRYYRFCGYLNCKIDKNISLLCKKYSKNLSTLSKERIIYELKKIISLDNSFYILKEMNRVVVLKKIFQLKLNLKMVSRIESSNVKTFFTEDEILNIKFISLFLKKENLDFNNIYFFSKSQKRILFLWKKINDIKKRNFIDFYIKNGFEVTKIIYFLKFFDKSDNIIKRILKFNNNPFKITEEESKSEEFMKNIDQKKTIWFKSVF